MRHLRILDLVEAVARCGSIRRAAEEVNLTASALNRRLAQFEDEFGSALFERLPNGVRLNPAGELFLQHARAQRADLARVRSRVAELAGARRGHVTVACSQALTPFFLPAEIARFRASHPGVEFTVNVRDRIAAEHDLESFAADLALVFEPAVLADVQILASVPQTVCAVMRRDHPLADVEPLRLRQCLDAVHVAPSERFGVRHLLSLGLRRSSHRLEPVATSDSFEFLRRYVLHEQAIGFEIAIGLAGAEALGLVVRPLSKADVPTGELLLGQLKGRTLPVAAARFAEHLKAALVAL
jgi:DNA-binding transcriptional LysR family regulator